MPFPWLPLIYKPSSISNHFVWPGHTFIMKKKWLRRDNTVNKQGMIIFIYLSCARHFLSLPSIYKPSFISIPFVLSKICPRQPSIMPNTMLRGDNSINIQARIMVLGFCPASHCHIFINQVSFQSLLYFSRYGQDRQHLCKMVKRR